MHSTATQTVAVEIIAMDYLSTERLLGMATSWHAHSSAPEYRYVWQVMAHSTDGAYEYAQELLAEDPEEAALALAAAGWTRSAIAFRLS